MPLGRVSHSQPYRVPQDHIHERTQFTFDDRSNGHAQFDTGMTACPTCWRPFTDEEQARQVHARHDAQEHARAEFFDRQLQEREERGRNEGTAAGQAASKELIEALVAEISSLKDGAETTINERTEAAIAKERLKMQA